VNSEERDGGVLILRRFPRFLADGLGLTDFLRFDITLGAGFPVASESISFWSALS
jgi:hypothetical protein